MTELRKLFPVLHSILQFVQGNASVFAVFLILGYDVGMGGFLPRLLRWTNENLLRVTDARGEPGLISKKSDPLAAERAGANARDYLWGKAVVLTFLGAWLALSLLTHWGDWKRIGICIIVATLTIWFSAAHIRGARYYLGLLANGRRIQNRRLAAILTRKGI